MYLEEAAADDFFLLNTKGEKYKAHDTLFSVFSMCSDERANGKNKSRVFVTAVHSAISQSRGCALTAPSPCLKEIWLHNYMRIMTVTVFVHTKVRYFI